MAIEMKSFTLVDRLTELGPATRLLGAKMVTYEYVEFAEHGILRNVVCIALQGKFEAMLGQPNGKYFFSSATQTSNGEVRHSILSVGTADGKHNYALDMNQELLQAGQKQQRSVKMKAFFLYYGMAALLFVIGLLTITSIGIFAIAGAVYVISLGRRFIRDRQSVMDYFDFQKQIIEQIPNAQLL